MRYDGIGNAKIGKLKKKYNTYCQILFDYTFDFFPFELLQKHVLIRLINEWCSKNLTKLTN